MAKKLVALTVVELKKLYRDPTSIATLLAMPIVLTVVFWAAMRDMPSWWLPGASHFEFLVPGAMGFAVIYMIMIVAMGLCAYREAGLLKRLQTTPVSPGIYLGSHILANTIIGIVEGLVVLGISVALGYRAQGGIGGLGLSIVYLGLLSIVAVGLGLITATVAKNSGAASALSMIFVVPMMIFGTFLAAFRETTYEIGRFTPNFYLTESLTRIYRADVFPHDVLGKNMAMLAVLAVVASIAGIQLFKRTEFR